MAQAVPVEPKAEQTKMNSKNGPNVLTNSSTSKCGHGKLNLDRFELNEKLEIATSANSKTKIYLVKTKDDKREFVLKETTSAQDPTAKWRFGREIAVYNKLFGKNSVNHISGMYTLCCYLAVESNCLFSFLTPKYGLNLRNYMNLNEKKNKQSQSIGLETNEALTIFMDVAIGLLSLHDLHIVWADLKAENILIDENLKIKLIDFGVSTVIQPGEWIHTVKMLQRNMGTLGYMSPQRLLQIGYNMADDLWALSVLFCEMIFGKNPFEPSIKEKEKEKENVLKSQASMIESKIANKQIVSSLMQHQENLNELNMKQEMAEMITACLRFGINERNNIFCSLMNEITFNTDDKRLENVVEHLQQTMHQSRCFRKKSNHWQRNTSNNRFVQNYRYKPKKK